MSLTSERWVSLARHRAAKRMGAGIDLFSLPMQCAIASAELLGIFAARVPMAGNDGVEDFCDMKEASTELLRSYGL